MVQIFLHHTPRLVGSYAPSQAFQFLMAQSWYLLWSLSLAVLWLLLRQRGFTARWLQTSTALFAALGSRNPSSAIFAGSFLLPAVTFYAITQFLLQRDHLLVLVVIAVGYGFTIAAMLIPALSEFDVSLDRDRGGVGLHRDAYRIDGRRRAR